MPGIVLEARDTAVNKTDKIPVFRGLIFQKQKMVNKTKKVLCRKIDTIMLLRKIRQGREKGSTGGGGSGENNVLRR